MQGSPQEEADLRSEEVDEIISEIPGWVNRWGIATIGFVFLGFLILSWFIKYRDIIQARVVLTTSPPPITLVSRSGGILRLLKKENTLVKPGELIGYLHTNADPFHVLALDSVLKKRGDQFPAELSLGELQTLFTSLVNAVNEKAAFQSLHLQDKQVARLREQEWSHRKLILTMTEQMELQKKELRIAHEKFGRDSILFTQQVFSRQDYNNAEAAYLQQLRGYQNAKTSLINNDIQIASIRSQIEELEAGGKNDSMHYSSAVENTRKELLAQIELWKETYLLSAPVSGRLAYLRFMEDGEYIERGKQVFSLIPDTKDIYAQAELPIIGSGKVKQGQDVNIKLENYPYSQFGMIRGKVVSISELPSDKNYHIRINVPAGLVTTYNKELPFRQQLQGDTEIITEDLRVIERVFYEFTRLLTSR